MRYAIVAPASRPNFLVEGIARVIVKFAGSLPMAEAVRGGLALFSERVDRILSNHFCKGNVSDDPRVEEEFRQDRMSAIAICR